MRSLVLSGGGSKGAFQVGAVTHLLGELGARYDRIYGVSVGALNGAFLAQYPHGAEVLAASELESFWSGIRTRHVHRRWFPFGKLHGLWRSSFYDSRPLQHLVADHFSVQRVRDSGRQLSVYAVSLRSGLLREWTERDGDLTAGVLASASFPAFLLPIEARGELHTDGGAREITPLGAAIKAGATHVDVVICQPQEVTESHEARPSAVRVATRTIEILTDEVLANDLAVCQAKNHLALAGEGTHRYVEVRTIRPRHPLGVDPLEFDPEDFARLAREGREAARAVLPSA